MITNAANRSYARLKSRRFFGLIVIGAAPIVALVLFGRTRHVRPERVLTDLGTADCVAVRQNRAWFIQPNSGAGRADLQCIDLSDGHRRTVSSLPSDNELRPGETLEDHPVVVGDSLFYFIYPRATHMMGGGGGFGLPIPKPDAKQPVVRRTVRIGLPDRTKGEAFYRVSLTDGRSERIAINAGGFSLQGLIHAVTATGFYWIRPRGGSATEITQGGRFVWMDYPADRDMMFTPWKGGAPRRIASGLTAISSLWADDDGVYWTTPRPYPDERRDLHILWNDRPMRLRVNSDFGSRNQPVLFRGRCFWINMPQRNSVDSPNSLCVVDLAHPDRISTVPLPSGRNGDASDPDRLIKHDGRLFVVFSGRAPRAEAPSAPEGYHGIPNYRPERFITRLYPDRPSPIGTSSPLPAPMAGGPQFLDGDYGYAITNETQRSFAAPLVDLFSANSAADKTTRCLYRIRLPE